MKKIGLPKFMASTGYDAQIGRILDDSVTEQCGYWLYGLTPKQAETIVKALKACKKYFGETNSLDTIGPKLDKALAILVNE